MKDRIREIMDSQGMSQQAFAAFIDISPATLSSIFNGRTKPTLNMVEAVKRKIPDISTDWLMFGTGSMYATPSKNGLETSASGTEEKSEIVDFDNSVEKTGDTKPRNENTAGRHVVGVSPVGLDFGQDVLKKTDIYQRRIIEIKVYYDDHTYESFVPSGKN